MALPKYTKPLQKKLYGKYTLSILALPKYTALTEKTGWKYTSSMLHLYFTSLHMDPWNPKEVCFKWTSKKEL